MDFNEYQELALRTSSEASQKNRILDGVMGLCGEAGECIDLVKKHLFLGQELNSGKLLDEASDCLWYLATIAAGLGVPLEEIAVHNVDKLKRRYPEGFSTEGSLERRDETTLSREGLVRGLWADIDAQRWEKLLGYFTADAVILWPNTGERFDVAGFVAANGHYPGDWEIEIERVVLAGEEVVSAIQTRLKGEDTSFRACSFFRFREGKIAELTEYWGDDGPPPDWRKD
ncbi:MAG: nuclear transport factor 2 family protein [Oscillospiraceae bacterium]